MTEDQRQRKRAYRQRPEVQVRAAWRRLTERYREQQREYQRRRRAGVGEAIYAQHRVALHAQQDGRCAICGFTLLPIGSDSHVDHIVPLGKGGGNDRANLQLLCPPCNARKGDHQHG